MTIITLVLVCVFKAVIVEGAAGKYGAGGDANWNFLDGSLGPLKWNQTFVHCGHNAQSPINIFTADTVYNKDLGKLEMVNYDATKTYVMKNRNTDIEFKPKESTNIPSLVFKGTTWQFHQFHFHWGSKSFQGSEHLVDWQQYAAEMHIIHYNTSYPNVSMAIDKPDGLMVWGHFLKVSTTGGLTDTPFKRLLDNFVNATECCDTTDVQFNLKDLLPSKHDNFFHYVGSLTTPPCHESVSWVVNTHPILVSESQMETFRGLRDVAMGNTTFVPLVDHYRPVQPLNSRQVQKNFEDAEEEDCEESKSNSGGSIKAFSSLIVAFAALFMCLVA